jgi:hypothetical protein
MKLALAALLLFAAAVPAEAKPGRYNGYESNSGWAEERTCFRKEYREEYVPGTAKNPGYVRKYYKKIRIYCEGPQFVPYRKNHRPYHHEEAHPNVGKVDDNSCIEGSVLGGIAGGGLGAALSRGDGRLWAIPLGIVGGAMAGCQVDGG